MRTLLFKVLHHPIEKFRMPAVLRRWPMKIYKLTIDAEPRKDCHNFGCSNPFALKRVFEFWQGFRGEGDLQYCKAFQADQLPVHRILVPTRPQPSFVIVRCLALRYGMGRVDPRPSKSLRCTMCFAVAMKGAFEGSGSRNPILCRRN